MSLRISLTSLVKRVQGFVVVQYELMEQTCDEEVISGNYSHGVHCCDLRKRVFFGPGLG